MRILVVSQYWHPDNGIPQHRWAWLTRVLEDAGHAVDVVCPHPTSGDEAVGHETLYFTHLFKPGSGLTRRALIQVASAVDAVRTGISGPEKPDVVIGTVPAIPTALSTWALAKARRVPYIIDLRDAWPDLLNYTDRWNESVASTPSLREQILRGLPTRIASSTLKNLMVAVLKQASGIVVTAESLANDLHRKGVDKPYMVTVRNVFPRANDYTYAPRAGRRDGTLNVLYAGTLGRAQMLSNAIAALKYTDGVTLRLVGSGAAREQLKRDAEGLPVAFYNKTKPEDLTEHYEWADVALVHLADWEPLNRAVPSKTYELMEMRMPITAAVEGEASEIIEQIANGRVVPTRDPHALARLWNELAATPTIEPGPEAGAEWVRRQRTEVSRDALADVLKTVTGA
ncbi:glycosyltransferase family 4 protein [Corynebacterium glucuronolyticum]|uniref:Glycosyltransferase family 4 protein n=2 Tax=Corynebacterium glucuronolyticum TaxID=39791 RepID=A0AAX1L8R3_9CORY|nr:glycosyltransferase family 4 protein [Corynebacterium glucuronolyticum]EEI64031.1 glycosyltransferase, group 1 family protein [Corynebacterium glucuronolyticum ATCC 51866]QRP70817.1 glycosyltransferase family 4 protein [Corynebacterium glucuronolyticum]